MLKVLHFIDRENRYNFNNFIQKRCLSFSQVLYAITFPVSTKQIEFEM